MANVLNKTLKDFIQEQLSVKEFEALPENMNITQNKITMIMKNPMIMDMSELFNLAEILGISWKKLIEEFVEPLK